MLGIETLAVKVSEIRSVGAAGFSDDTKMVSLNLANMKIKSVLDANQILIKENDGLVKVNGLLQVENERLRKNQKRREKDSDFAEGIALP
jgi:hypothetical protein